jgi:hypothetical protein
VRGALILLLLGCVAILAAFPEYSLSGTNKTEYIYRDAPDSVKNYLNEEFSLSLRITNWRAGFKYKLSDPEYDRYHPLAEGEDDGVEGEWLDRYLEFRNKRLFVRAGIQDFTIGSGMFFRTWRDEDFNQDTRIEGLLGSYEQGGWKLTGIGGTGEDPAWDGQDDTVGGLDLQYKLLTTTTVAATGFVFKNAERNGDSKQAAGGGRITSQHDIGDLFLEYGHTKTDQLENIQTGDAFYGAANGYFGNWIFTGAYKQYRNFHYTSGLNDPPILNHCGKPITESEKPGYDERGAMGEVRWTSESLPTVYLSYAEGWTHDWMNRESNFYLELKKELGETILTGSLETVEFLDKESDIWKKEITPAVSYDFLLLAHPMLVKLQNYYETKSNRVLETHHYEPMLQTDLAFKKFSVSVISQFYYIKMKDITDHDPWIGVEISAQLFEHTRLLVFAGQEKGGEVCRNGVCRYVPEFEGARISLQSQF